MNETFPNSLSPGDFLKEWAESAMRLDELVPKVRAAYGKTRDSVFLVRTLEQILSALDDVSPIRQVLESLSKPEGERATLFEAVETIRQSLLVLGAEIAVSLERQEADAWSLS